MHLLALALEVLPGTEARWQRMEEALCGPRHEDFVASRKRAGLRERTFLQTNPQGNVVIATFEGEDPEKALSQLVQTDDEFTRWFVAEVEAVHGLNLRSLADLPVRLVIDSGTP